MESHPAQPAAFFVGSQCRRGPTCPYLRRGRCLFFHPGDEAASASLVGRDQPPDGSVLACLARLERVVEQILAILVPQITKDIATMSQHAPAERVQMTTADRDQPGDQVRRDSAAVHRQGCPFACCDATTGPLAASSSDPGTNRGSREDLSSEAHLGAYCREDYRLASASDLERDRRGGEGIQK